MQKRHGPTNGPTDRRTDTPSYRVASSRLKTDLRLHTHLCSHIHNFSMNDIQQYIAADSISSEWYTFSCYASSGRRIIGYGRTNGRKDPGRDLRTDGWTHPDKEICERIEKHLCSFASGTFLLNLCRSYVCMNTSARFDLWQHLFLFSAVSFLFVPDEEGMRLSVPVVKAN